ncbi:hypothetical protein VTN77DRAFT_4735 [Rasamsonia byssochlamydoides]|uniref:uncharacterized protein n=1 Tax=Rasamsonia byssochlamydoides TaxID=89139 RepID=UPI00374481A1
MFQHSQLQPLGCAERLIVLDGWLNERSSTRSSPFSNMAFKIQTLLKDLNPLNRSKSCTSYNAAMGAEVVLEPTSGATRRGLRTFDPKHGGPLIKPTARASESATGNKQNGTEETGRSMRWLEVEDHSENDDEHYVLKCREKTNAYIRSITEPLNLVSIMGPTRSGKSTLMNLLAGCKTTELFLSSPGGESFTKGTDLGNRVMTVEEFSTTDGGEKVVPDLGNQKIAFVDTEGQGDQGDRYDIILFTPAILCSRVVIFNTTEVAKDKILTSLALTTQLADKVDLGDDPAISGPKFGALMIIINKYTLGDDEDAVRKNILGIERGTSQAVRRRNDIRKKVFSQFQDVSIHVLNGNSLKEGVQEKINKKEKKFLVLDDFIDSYVKRFNSIRADLSKKLKAPRLVAGKSLTGQSIADFVPAIVKEINQLEEEGQLHIPDIWQDAENEAINKACIAFRRDFKEECDKLHNSRELLTTRVCTEKLDGVIRTLLANVRNSLIYLTPQKISNTCNLLTDESQPQKDAVLEANLLKIKRFAQIELRNFIGSLEKRLREELPNKLVSTAVVTSKLDQLKVHLVDEYKDQIQAYDERALPSDFSKTYLSGFSAAEATLRDSISAEWKSWVLQLDNTSINSLQTALKKLTDSTTVGEDAKWESGADVLELSNISEYNNTIDIKYLWERPIDVKKSYAEKVKDTRVMAKAQFERNGDEIRKHINQELERQVLAYQTQLNGSLKPKEEPSSFDDITDATAYRDQFKQYFEQQKISGNLASDFLARFDARVSSLKADFRREYMTVHAEFLTYLENELARIIRLRLEDFKMEADSIAISKTLLRSELDSKLVAHARKTLNDFEANVKTFKISQADGRNRVNTARHSLEDNVLAHQRSKFILLHTVVEVWNRQTMNKYGNVVLSGVADYTIDTVEKLSAAIDTAKESYFREACGEFDEKEKHWIAFQEKTPRLYENIRRCQNLFIIKDVDRASITSDMEKRVIEKLRVDCADLANLLGMSWICSDSKFALETTAQGNARSHLLCNLDQPDGYDSAHRTSLRFHDWKAEFSDFVFDDPIVQELEPFEIDTVQGPRQDEDALVHVRLQTTQTETVSNTNILMSKISAEYSTKVGLDCVFSGNVKAAFESSAAFSNTKENQVQFGVNFDYPVVCPANRKTTIHCLGYKQRVSVTYTAKVRLIPKLTFTGGFTRWGGKNNENPNFLRGHNRQRVYHDIDNGYTNEFREKAAADANPWRWHDCIEKYKSVQTLVDRISADENYEMYVRGKWEGITGWKHVIQTDIKVE